jgi:hypothetical protein
MNQLASRMGFWSASIIIVLVAFIDAGMIVSAILFPMTTISSIEAYASSFRSVQMLPFIPSLMLAPIFVVMMLSIHHYASDEKESFQTTWLFLRPDLRHRPWHPLLHPTNLRAAGPFK